MKKFFAATLVAAVCAAAAVTAPAPAQAGNGGAIVGAAVGGLAVGTFIGAAAAYPAYRPLPGYVVYSGYGVAYPVACPGGFWARKPVAFDRAGRPVAWSKPRFICP